MSHHLNYSAISWEDFEDICLALWFDEGYTRIEPMGRRHEGGRDAIFRDMSSGEFIIFQYKRWAEKYDASQLKSMIKVAAQKIAEYKPNKFILNSSHEPNATVKDWIPDLVTEVGFEIEYWDRSWSDLRLDNQRQDLRRHYFGVDLAYHTWNSLISHCTKQVKRTIQSLSSKFNEEMYVTRDIESKLFDFEKSDKIGLAIVDNTGRGKTNLICSTALQLIQANKAVIIVRGDATLVDDNALEQLVSDALGYDKANYQLHLQDVARLLQDQGEICFIFLDGLSEATDIARVNRSVRNLLVRLAELKNYRLCLTCRDSAWPHISYDLPMHLFQKAQSKYEHHIDDFSDAELDIALQLYPKKYKVDFAPDSEARHQLKHPLLLRLFCEAFQGQTLGRISSIPISPTFDKYLEVKIDTVIARLEFGLSRVAILQLLRDMAGGMWRLGDTYSLSEQQWRTLLPPNISYSDGESVLQVLQAEGIVRIKEEPFTLERTLRIVFDELRDYLILHYLLAQLFATRIESTNDLPNHLLSFIATAPRNADTFKLLSLVGLLLPAVSARHKFLRALLHWDFHTFCLCLTYITPSGTFHKCKYQSLKSWAEEVRGWYQEIANTTFDETYSLFDPWKLSSNKTTSIGIDVLVSPKCREISYNYWPHDPLHKASKEVKVTQVSQYPTFDLWIGTKTEKMRLHDPDNGLAIPVFPNGPNGITKRIINSTFPPQYAGESINIPERRALYDIWYEASYLIENRRLPLEPEGLVNELNRSYQAAPVSQSDFDDQQLVNHLVDVLANSIMAYSMIVDKYFPKLKNVLSVSVLMPCKLGMVTNRVSVKYALIPISEEISDSISHDSRVVEAETDVGDPKWRWEVSDEAEDTIPLDAYTKRKLDQFGKMRSPVFAIDRIEPIEWFFSKTPVYDLTKRWLLSDLRLVFGF